ncbi:MAG: hypothetical protein AAF614_20010 [Chloroflexota bacterium]
MAITIATKNRPSYLAALLASLVQQTFPHWVLVINDQSDEPVAAVPVVRDLLKLLETQGHEVIMLCTTNPRDRYQRLLEAVPEGIEFVHRIDDDVVLRPDYLAQVQRPFSYFPDRPIAAVGGCLPAPHMQPLSLAQEICRPDWFPRIDTPTWRMQGHLYKEREVIEMESLWGCALCYRRSAAEAVGGWEVAGQSPQIFREDSDMSARWVVAGYELLMTTAAIGWHLVAPSGGAREVTKMADGSNRFDSHRHEYDADDALFRQRLAALLADGYERPEFSRYLIADLERGRLEKRPLRSRRHQLQFKIGRSLPRPVRRVWQFVRSDRS